MYVRVYIHIDCAEECQFKSYTHVRVHVAVKLAGRMFFNDVGQIGQRSRTFVAWTLGLPDVEFMASVIATFPGSPRTQTKKLLFCIASDGKLGGA